MIGLDTNIMVRYLVKDDPVQAKKASSFMRSHARKGEMFFLNSIVFCELVWVLETAYDYGRREIADALEKLLLTAQFEFEDKDSLWAALAEYKARSKGDFSDYLISRKNHKSGCNHTATFDRDLKDAPGFQWLA